jgi:hypothetical protein
MMKTPRTMALLFFFGISLIHLFDLDPARAGSEDGNGVLLSLYQEQYQNAFSILLPKGWKAEGGMIPSGVQWNVVDLVENNIKFRITSPDGKSFFGWYPRFYFQDPQVFVQSKGVCFSRRLARF